MMDCSCARAQRSGARAQSLATVLVLESLTHSFAINFDYEHRFAEHEHEKVRSGSQDGKLSQDRYATSDDG